MCKEDIRIARKAVPKQVINDTGKTAAYKVLNANANRYSIGGALVGTTIVDANKIPMLAAKVGNRYFPLVVSGNHSGGYTVSIGEVGQAITYEIWFLPADGSNTYSVYAAETELEQTLEQV